MLRDAHCWRRRQQAVSKRQPLLLRRQMNRSRNPSDPDTAAPIPVRATSPVTGRIPICSCRPTDHGTLPNLRFSFSDSHVRQETGGWTRQVTVRELGVSKDIAGVNMRLNAGGVRELHWHKAAEWAYMLYGSARIIAIDAQGHNFVDDVREETFQVARDQICTVLLFSDPKMLRVDGAWS